MAGRCILVLGGGGFVGAYLVAALAARFGNDAHIINTTRSPQDGTILSLDICNTESARAIVRQHRPTHVINLAGIAAPAEAHRKPELAWELHALAPDRLGRMLHEEVPECWFLHVSSGLIYGRTARDGRAIDETARLDPMDTYAMTKAAGDLALGVLAGQGLKCLRLRPFNHTGPGQSEDFAVPAFAAQIARIKTGLQEPILTVGNLAAIRDFLDVRDVAKAYVELVQCTDTVEPGAIYNIASGAGRSMSDILDRLVEISGVEITIELDPNRQRASDLPVIIGNAEALSRQSGWSQQIPMEQTLTDTLAYFLDQVAN